MIQVNMHEAKTNLSSLIEALELGQEKVISIARNGTPVAQLTLAPKPQEESWIGIGASLPPLPEDYDMHEDDDLVAEMFGAV